MSRKHGEQERQEENVQVIQCVAVNHVGKSVASTQLVVVCVPKFTSTDTL